MAEVRLSVTVYMADEDLDLDLDNEVINNKVEKRIKDLSEKVKLAAHERDEKDGLLKEKDDQLATANKERDFYSSFADSTSKYPGASEYKDAIKEKVMSGYTVEDATVATLAKEGKLGNYIPPASKPDSPAGGSATNQLKNESDKPVNEMSRDEKRAALDRLESEEGGVSQMLRRNM